MTTTPADYAPLDDNYETEILPNRRRSKLPLLTVLLALALAAAAAFLGGVEIQKHYGGSSTAGSVIARLMHPTVFRYMSLSVTRYQLLV